MNWLDIVILLLGAAAVWEGWRQGVITQILGLAALVLGIWLALRHGSALGAWLGMEDAVARIVGFIIVLVGVILCVVLIGRLTRGLFRIVGLGVFDGLLGALFSLLKMALFVGLVMMVIGFFDPEGRVVTAAVKEGSRAFGVVKNICDMVFPFVGDMFSKLL